MSDSIAHVIRQTARSIFLDMSGAICNLAPGIHILNGHVMAFDNNKIDCNVDRFKHLLKELSHNARFIRFEEAVKLIKSKQTNVEFPMIAFSWDDGFMEQYTHIAPILEEFGVNAAFFINPNFVDGDDDYISRFTNQTVLTPGKKPMRWKEIIDLQNRGHIIGAHTLDHYMINSDDVNVLRHQIVDCREVIEKHLGAECEYFAFPYGKLSHANKRSIDIACENYKYVFSQSDYKHYFSFDGRVINRRHFEPFWNLKHVKYFLSFKKD